MAIEAMLDSPPVKAENARLERLDIEKGKDETKGFRICTRLMRKEPNEFVIGKVVKVVTKSDAANAFQYAYVWVVWEDGTCDAPGSSRQHNMRKNYDRFEQNDPHFREPTITRSDFIAEWCAHPPRHRPHARAHTRALLGAPTPVRGLAAASHPERCGPSLTAWEPPVARRSFVG